MSLKSPRQYTTLNQWQSLSTAQRCDVIATVAPRIVSAADDFIQLCTSDQRTDPVETITAELLPLCAALQWIGRRGARTLQPRKLGIHGRPAWLWGIHSEVRRQPWGRVLVLGTWNYSLLLAGAQTAQAIAAGNSVHWKPAPGCEAATARLIGLFHDAGVPTESLTQLDSSSAAAKSAIDRGVDLIVLTGAAATGRAVMQQAAESLTPTIMELSGCDAAVVLPGANIDRVAAAIAFGILLNSGATCIAPRRIVVTETMAEPLADALQQRLASAASLIVHPAAREAAASTIESAINRGAVDRLNHFAAGPLRQSGHLKPVLLDRVAADDEIATADLFAPVTSIVRVADTVAAASIVNDCPYRLAVSVFGPTPAARSLAAQLQVGTVTVNDLVVPTADPRLPFGGRGHSGFGVTRGAEGLLAMTTPQVISRRRGHWAPHLAKRQPGDAETLLGTLQLLHGGTLAARIRGFAKMLAAARQSSFYPQFFDQPVDPARDTDDDSRQERRS